MKQSRREFFRSCAAAAAATALPVPALLAEEPIVADFILGTAAAAGAEYSPLTLQGLQYNAVTCFSGGYMGIKRER